jgi:hypothetical protein
MPLATITDAGFDVLCLIDPEKGDTEETAVKVCTAMEAARRSLSGKHQGVCLTFEIDQPNLLDLGEPERLA